MRIGVVTDNYFPSVGGTEISIWNYAKKLRKQGHEVFIFCPSHGRKNPKKPHPGTVRLRSLRGIYPDHPIIFTYPGVTKLFAQYDLDILHSQTPVSAPYVAEYVARKLHIPHIHTLHTLVPEQVKRWKIGLVRFFNLFLMQSIILKNFKKPENYLLQDESVTMATKVRLSWIYLLRLVRIPDRVIFPSKHVKEIFAARGFKGKVSVLPTFSDMFEKNVKLDSKRPPNDHAVRFALVGRLDIEKRPQIVIDAMNLLPDYLDWRLIIIGDGSQRNKVQRLVNTYGLEERIIFKGRKKQAEIASELLDADALVMPSYRFDTQGVVLLEACGAGIPIVYCDDNLTVGVEESNSILTKPYAMSMSTAIQELIENPRLRKELGKASLEVAKKYRSEKLTKKLLRIYRQTIKDHQNTQSA
ncbi:MAG: glycosyltransferase [Candidatus Saccharibacteria bacterium]|nr:glycosyltransferase [Candidatus Saccharibacteria bacterium]